MSLLKLFVLLFPLITFSQTYKNGEWSKKEHIPQTQKDQQDNKDQQNQKNTIDKKKLLEKMYQKLLIIKNGLEN